MSTENDNNNYVMPNDSEEEKLPDSLDPRARPEAEAAREEHFKQNILMDVDERPEGVEAYEEVQAKREVEQAEDQRKESDEVVPADDSGIDAEGKAIPEERDEGSGRFVLFTNGSSLLI